jgi:RNA polymerase sigma-70 factor (ECF subfamily)
MSERTPASFGSLVAIARDPRQSLDARHTAFTSLVHRSQHIVFALALSSLRDVDDARDAAQEAFATAWRRLHQLRDAQAFPAWLKSIVAAECARCRRRTVRPASTTPATSVDADVRHLDYDATVAAALEGLSKGERHVIVLYYFLGLTLTEIARLLRLKPGTIGKRLHSARLRVRRELPRCVRGDFVRLGTDERFASRVGRGLLDEYTGQYRFEGRPDHIVEITREGDSLISTSGAQRHLLLSGGRESLLTRHYDGEGRFRRDGQGRIASFVYYEFGKRLGVAWKNDGRATDA